MNSQLVFRPFRDGDAEALAVVREKCGHVDGFDAHSTLESLPSATEIENVATSAKDKEGSAFSVVESEGEIVGYATIRSWSEESGVHVYLHDGFVTPAVRGSGIGTSMIRWCENEIERFASSMNVADQAVFGANASSSEPHRVQLLADNGYNEVFSLVEMELVPLSAAASIREPDTFSFRAAEEADVKVLYELNNEVYAGREFVGVATEEGLAEFRAALNDLGLVNIVLSSEPSERVVGFVSSAIRDGIAEITEVSVHPDFRRNGLGSTLLAGNLNALARRGVEMVRLHTSGENVSGARTLYEQFGFKPVKNYMRYRKKVH